MSNDAPWPTLSEDNPLDVPCRLELSTGGEPRTYKCIADMAERAVEMAWQEFGGDMTTYVSWLDAVALLTKKKIAEAEQLK